MAKEMRKKEMGWGFRRKESRRERAHAFQEDELVNLLTGEGPELPKPTPESEPSARAKGKGRVQAT